MKATENGAIAAIDNILDMPKAPDAVDVAAPFQNPKKPTPSPQRVSLGVWLPAVLRWRRNDDDDDDPPPYPAVVAPFPRLPPCGAAADLEAA
jgi:hypothetical protein